MFTTIKEVLVKLRQQKPLILCLTNSVTQDFVANSLLALGAAPIMSACEEELEELVIMASCVYINLGTLNADFVRLASTAKELSQKHNKPLILDPVGAGATPIRTQTALSLSTYSSIIRGNASEIMALSNTMIKTHGVEAAHSTEDAKDCAKQLALANNATVIVSGPVDFITNGTQSEEVHYGSALMQQVTGMGCAMTAVVAAFLAVIKDPFKASHLATFYFGYCGQKASITHIAPGSFKSAFIDTLFAGELE